VNEQRTYRPDIGNRPIEVSIRDGVAVISVDNPPVNALSPGVPEALAEALLTAERETSVLAIVIIGSGKTFIAGADITTLEHAAWGDMSAAADLHGLLARIEHSSKPVVMAIHGTALGGGLELAMAGHYRVATASALLGQPEVTLGIIPGAEGTQRLPRLVGIEKALDMCVSGRPLKAGDALAAGLIDAIVDNNLANVAVEFASRVASNTTHTRTSERSDRLGHQDTNAPLFAAARDLARKTRRRQIAPLKVVDAIEAAGTLPFAEGCRRERELFFECVQSEQAKALIHVFFAERAAAKVKGLPRGVAGAAVERVAIIGAGTMGGGIAMACANAGLSVVLKDKNEAAVEKGLSVIRRNYDISVARGRLTKDAVGERMQRIHPDLNGSAVADADLVIEAVFEDLDLKKEIFGEMDEAARPDAVLATNTSTLDIDQMAGATSRPEAVVGLHFFSPAHVMRLLEIVRGRATSPQTMATSLAFARRLGKIPVVVGNCRGFVGNRLMFPYMNEAQFLVEEGATPEQVDRALTDFGMAMGIFAVDDMAGIDVAWRARRALEESREPGTRRPLVQDKLYELGRVGQKSGKGWYRYDEQRKAAPDPVVTELIRATATAQGIPQRTFTDADIIERTLYALINEGARALEEGFAARASDIDTIYINGYGFPAWRGGPMFFADREGLQRISERVGAFHEQFGARWTPAPLLSALARTNSTFREFDRSRA
jgi:3-hydroxyacyl-CoA dehydrogenase